MDPTLLFSYHRGACKPRRGAGLRLFASFQLVPNLRDFFCDEQKIGLRVVDVSILANRRN